MSPQALLVAAEGAVKQLTGRDDYVRSFDALVSYQEVCMEYRVVNGVESVALADSILSPGHLGM